MSAAPAGDAAARTSMFFDDFQVGQRFVSSPRTITQADVEQFTALSGDAAAIHVDPEYAESQGFAGPLVHGPLGIATVFGLLFEMDLVRESAVAVLDLHWEFKAPVLVDDDLTLEMTVTRCRPSREKSRGVVNRHFRLRNGQGAVVQEGTSAFIVRARGGEHGSTDSGEGRPTRAATDFCTAEWAQVLVPRLEQHRDFVAAVGQFDGAIELQAGRETVQLRIYKGRVIEVARRLPHGATFTLAGNELAWLELAEAERNDFIARAMTGQFGVRGNTYEYLRLTKALVALCDCVRDLARGELDT